MADIENKEERPMCRICYGEDDGEENGKLFSPCRCRGSVRYIHTECLKKWRATGGRASYECPQCKYNYRIARAQASEYITSTIVVHFFTIVVFFMLLFAGGVVARALDGIFMSDEGHLLPETMSLLVHFLAGAVVVGLIGFFSFFVQILAGGVNTCDCYWYGGCGGSHDNDSCGGMVLVVMVVIGLGVALYKVHQYVKERTGEVLEGISDQVLEVHQGDFGESTTIEV